MPASRLFPFLRTKNVTSDLSDISCWLPTEQMHIFERVVAPILIASSVALLIRHLSRSEKMSTLRNMIIFPPFDAPSSWRAVDDRVRGGASVSHLEPIYESSYKDEGEKEKARQIGVRFWGELGEYPPTDTFANTAG